MRHKGPTVKKLAILLAVWPSLAFAQQAPTLDQRIGSHIGQLVIQNEWQAIQIEQLQAALSAAQARVKALEDKYEPKPKDAPAN